MNSPNGSNLSLHKHEVDPSTPTTASPHKDQQALTADSDDNSSEDKDADAGSNAEINEQEGEETNGRCGGQDDQEDGDND